MDKQELEDRIECHKEWLHSDELRGVRFAAIGDDLTGVNLAGFDLSKADFSHTKLNSADLNAVNLSGATLDGTVLYDSDLRKANLEKVSGLSRRDLAGTDLSNAILPEQVKDFPLVETAKEISEQAQKLTLLVVASCFYCWLTIGATTDASLVLNTGTAKLPLAGVEIPTATFFIVAPTILVALHIYLHLYLQRFWECLAWLPAVFPDGQRLDRRAFSWLLADVVRSELPRLKVQNVAFGRLGQSLSKAMIWWLVPLTLVIFFQRNLISQHVGSLGVQIFLLAIVLVFTWRCRRVMRTTLSRELPLTYGWLRGFTRLISIVSATAMIAAIIGGWTWLAYSSLDAEGMVHEYEGPEGSIRSYSNTSLPIKHNIFAKLAAISLSFGKSRLNADLSGSRLINVPEMWRGDKVDDFSRIQGANLSNRNLQRLNARNSFFVKSDFSGSNLKGTDFTNTDLRMMKYGQYYENVEGWGILLGPREFTIGQRSRETLIIGTIENVNFSHADLRFARLWLLGLPRCEFFRADLRNASIGLNNGQGPSSFIAADLRGAVLKGGSWEHTLFYGARLEGADLSEISGLTSYNLAFVTIDKNTRLPKNLLPPRTIKTPLTDYQAALLVNALDYANVADLPKLSSSSPEFSRVLMSCYSTATREITSPDSVKNHANPIGVVMWNRREK